jgi:hypothetical protein
MSRGTAAVIQLEPEVPQGLKHGASEGPDGSFSPFPQARGFGARAHGGRALDCTNLAMAPSGDLLGTAKEKGDSADARIARSDARHMRRQRRRRRKPSRIEI